MKVQLLPLKQQILLVVPSSATDAVLSTVSVGASLTLLTVIKEVFIVVAPPSSVAVTVMVSSP
jgi:hypothetical protein